MGGIVDRLVGGIGKLAEAHGGQEAELAAGGLKSAWDHIEGMVKSSEALFKTTPAGKPFVDEVFKAKYIPTLKRGIQDQLKLQEAAHAGAGLPPENFKADPMKAIVTARQMARVHAFGANDEVLISFVNQARKESKSEVHADNVGFALSTILHENFAELYKPVKWGVDADGIMHQPSHVNRPVTWLEKAGITKVPKYEPPNKVEQGIRNVMGYVFTPFIAIPHLTQILNPILDLGIKHVAEGTAEMFAKSPHNLKQLERSAVLADEIYYGLASPDAGWMKKIFHHPGFTPVRKKYIEIAALAGRSALYDSAAEFLASRGADKASGVMLRHLGINTDEFLSRNVDHALKFSSLPAMQELGLNPEHLTQLRLTPDDILTAMYRSGAESMFIRDGLNTPAAWDTSALRRMMFMYKHYAWSQGKFLRDVLQRSYEAGGMPAVASKLAIIGTVLPAAGEIIKGAERWVHGDTDSDSWREYNAHLPGMSKEDDVSEYLDAMAHVAGFGMVYTTIRSAQRNALAGMVIGPLFNSSIDIVQDVANMRGRNVKELRHGDKLSPTQRKFGRDIVSRTGIMGPLLSHTMFPRKQVKHKHKPQTSQGE